MASRSLASLLLALVWALVACAPIAIELSRPTPQEGSGQLLIGAGKSDITPIPGYPMAGHSFEGEYSAGNLGRLYARALYLEDPGGQPVVLLAADVWAVSIGLRDRVVELLQEEHGLAHLGREHLVLGATHTHHSPAANASNHAHNLAAGKIWAFDRELFEFLARKLARAVVDAHASREPARLWLARPAVADFARNRSLDPFEQNPEADEVVAENAELPACTLSQLTAKPRACKAIDPGITVLMAEAVGDRRLIAAGVFMAVHATAMPNTTVYYQGDVFGLAAVELERRLADTGAPVVAIFNGPEGDVSPTWAEQSYADMLRVAGNVADGVWPSFAAWREQEADALRSVAGRAFRVRHDLFRLSGQSFVDEHGTRRVTGRRGMMATSMLAGAEDGPTAFRKTNPEGRRRRKAREESHGHGYKQRSFLQASEKQLPAEAPLSVIDLDGAVVATLPGEFTTVLGRRIRHTLAGVTGADPGAVALVGLANEYRSYFTTPEEYALQHYEGGSTIYGTYSGTLVRTRLACLAGLEPSCKGTEYPLARVYGPGPQRRTGFVERPRRRVWLRRIRKKLDESIPPTRGVTRPVMRFEDRAPPWPRPVDMAPRASVEVANGCRWQTLRRAGVPQTDDAYRVLNMVARLSGARWSWETIWLTPALEPEQRARIRVVGVDGIPRCSAVITTEDLRSSSAELLLTDVGCQAPPGCESRARAMSR